MPSLEVDICDRLTSISAADWGRLFPTLADTYGSLQALEQSGMEAFAFGSDGCGLGRCIFRRRRAELAQLAFDFVASRTDRIGGFRRLCDDAVNLIAQVAEAIVRSAYSGQRLFGVVHGAHHLLDGVIDLG